MKLPTNCKMLVNANLMALEWDINPQSATEQFLLASD